MGREKKKTAASYGLDPFADLEDFPVIAPPVDDAAASADSVAPAPTNGVSENDQTTIEAGPDFPWSVGEEAAAAPLPEPRPKRIRKHRATAPPAEMGASEPTPLAAGAAEGGM